MTFFNLGIVLLTFYSSLFGLCESIEDIKPLKKEIQNLTQEDLVVFDIDNTLLTYQDPALRFHQRQYIKKQMKSYGLSLQYYDYLWSIILKTAPWRIIDKNIYSVLDYLKQKKIKVIACTACPCNQFEAIDSLTEWRLEQFQKFKINFSYSFPQNNLVKLIFPCEKKSCIFKKGILLSGDLNKGEAVRLLLKSVHFKPKRIIFIDDQIEFIKKVEKVMDQEKIDFIGLHYKGFKHLNDTIDYSLTNFQVKYLIQNQIWLKDSEAKKLIPMPVHQ